MGEHAPRDVRLRHLRMTAERPLLAYSLSCGAHCSMCLLWVVLAATLGSTFFPLFTNVPLYLLHDTAKERRDGFTRGQEVATWTPGTAEVELARTVTEDATGEELRLEIMYIGSDSQNVLTQRTLARIRDLEAVVFADDEYRDYCELDWTRADFLSDHFFVVPDDAASPAFAAGTNVTISEYCLTNTTAAVHSYCNRNFAEHRRVPCVPPLSVGNPCDRTTHASVATAYSTNCADVASYPIGLFDCPLSSRPCAYGEAVPLSDADFAAKLQGYADYATYLVSGEAVKFKQAAQFVYKVTGSTFGGGVTTAQALMSTWYFGLPRPGYETTTDDHNAQVDDIGDWLYSAYASELFDADVDGVHVYFNGYEMQPNFIQDQLVLDAAWVVASFVFVLLFLTYQTGSWWKSLMGMGQILMSFSSAYFLYFGVFSQRYFGVFNVLSVFIILGIGADDIFVFLDAFSQSSLEEFQVPQDLHSRLSWTWRRAAKAMAVTSATTMASFLANATSSFPAISTFGIFAAMLVLVNYCSVVLYYPTVVAMYETVFTSKENWCGRQRFCCGALDCLGSAFVRVEAFSHNMTVEEWKKKRPKRISTEEWFANTYAPWVRKAKYWIMLAFAAAFVFFLVLSVRLEVEQEAPRFLPASNNFGSYSNKKAANFARGGSIYALDVNAVFGLDMDNPIDRHGTSPSNSTDLGEPVFDPNFDLVKGLPCMAQICDSLTVRNDSVEIGGAPEFQVTCFATAYRNWYVATYGSDEFEQYTGLNCTADDTQVTLGPCWSNFRERVREFFSLSGGVNYDTYTPYLYGEECDDDVPEEECPNGGFARMAYADVKLTAEFTISFEDGMSLWHDMDAWFTWQGTTDKCAGDAGFNKYLPGFFTGRFWDFFFVQEVLVREAFLGILVSLLLAWAVLVLATGNAIVGTVAAIMIACIVMCVIGFTVLMGWKLGITETINFVMVPGMSVDYVAHLAEAYAEAHSRDRYGRVRTMLQEVGISIVSGAITSLGAAFFLFFPLIVFFNKFGAFIFATILLSLLWAMLMFPAVLALCGPQGDTGNWHKWAHGLIARRHGKAAVRPMSQSLAEPAVEQEEDAQL